MASNQSPHPSDSGNTGIVKENEQDNNKPSRRTIITLPWQIYRSLEELSSAKGRLISNLASSLLDRQIALEDPNNNS